MANDIRVIRCGKCDARATVIFDGLYYCSRHGLIVVLEQLERAGRSDMAAAVLAEARPQPVG